MLFFVLPANAVILSCLVFSSFFPFQFSRCCFLVSFKWRFYCFLLAFSLVCLLFFSSLIFSNEGAASRRRLETQHLRSLSPLEPSRRSSGPASHFSDGSFAFVTPFRCNEIAKVEESRRVVFVALASFHTKNHAHLHFRRKLENEIFFLYLKEQICFESRCLICIFGRNWNSDSN